MKLDAFYYHEVADRCDVVQHIIEDHIFDHPAMTVEQREKIEKAQNLIGEVYQWAAQQDCAYGKQKKSDSQCCDRGCYNCDKWDKQPDAEGWIEWHGGECPVPGDTKVQTCFRSGDRYKCLAKEFVWELVGEPDDIIAYRVVKS